MNNGISTTHEFIGGTYKPLVEAFASGERRLCIEKDACGVYVAWAVDDDNIGLPISASFRRKGWLVAALAATFPGIKPAAL